MDDWLDSANDGLEDNAGVLGAMGGMAALNNQRASLNKLSEIKDELAKAQASAAKTEKERLAIEKKRLALEQAHLEEQKNTAEAVKELRILMADAATLLERISQMAAAPSSGGDSYDLDLTRTAALIQVKVELVEKNSAVLSDLADLKEQRRLKTQFEIKLSEFVSLKHLPENPLSFVEKEVFDQLQEIWSVFGSIEELSNERALKIEGGKHKGYLISEEKLLSRKQGLTKALERLQTLDQLKAQSAVAGRFTKNHFEESETLWGQFYFLKSKRPDYDFSGTVHCLKKLIDEPQLKEQMEGGGADALATIESHITSARDQGAMLDDATHRISLGDFDLARSVEQIPKAERYANPLFAENHDRLVELNWHTDCFLPSIDFSAVDLPSLSSKIKKAWDVLGVESWPDNSDLKQRISKNKKIVLGAISKRERLVWISVIGGFFIVMGYIWLFFTL
ncbi:hypothetical protein OAF44_01435 [Akkermansiaceae bacterium]|nr:hypothetical protein [Akkermansiaceae bacterium]MDB4725166.1 hypothetical protein [Akkermansiaceae bacterium]